MPFNSEYRRGADPHPPVLSVGKVARTLIDLQGALTRAFTLILLHSEEEKNRTGHPKSIRSDSFWKYF